MKSHQNRGFAPGAWLARQLGGPRGWFGSRVITRMLNRGNRELISSTIAALEAETPRAILDVGFGGGVGLALAAERWSGAELVGVDPSEAACEGAARLHEPLISEGRLTLIRASVEALPFEADRFDAILSTNTLYFWPELAPPFAELRRVLCPGGELAFGFSGGAKLAEFAAISRHGFHLREPEEIVETLGATGFGEVDVDVLSGRRTTGDYVVRAR